MVGGSLPDCGKPSSIFLQHSQLSLEHKGLTGVCSLQCDRPPSGWRCSIGVGGGEDSVFPPSPWCALQGSPAARTGTSLVDVRALRRRLPTTGHTLGVGLRTVLGGLRYGQKPKSFPPWTAERCGGLHASHACLRRWSAPGHNGWYRHSNSSAVSVRFGYIYSGPSC